MEMASEAFQIIYYNFLSGLGFSLGVILIMLLVSFNKRFR